MCFLFSSLQKYISQFFSDVGVGNATLRRLIRSNFTEDLETMQSFFGLEVVVDFDFFFL